MSMRAVVISLVLAILLGLTALLVLEGPSLGLFARSSPSLPVGARLLNFAPSSVMDIRVAFPDGVVDQIQRAVPPAPPAPDFAADAEWLLQTARPSQAAPSKPWPIAPARMQGLLRILADAAAVGLPSRDHSLGQQPTIVTISFRDGSIATLALAQRTLAGTGVVEITIVPPASAAPVATNQAAANPPAQAVTKKLAIVSDELHRVFTSPGPRGWRDRAILGPIAAQTSRIKLEIPNHRLSLGKVNNTWVLREPVATTADPAAVNKLLSTLARVQIAEFLDQPPVAQTGLESPAARLILEADERSLAPAAATPDPAPNANAEPVQTRIRRVELSIGSPVDAQARRLFAKINNEQLVELESAGLDALTLDPTAMIWPHPSRSPLSDIAGFSMERISDSRIIRTREFARLDLRWTETRQSAAAAATTQDLAPTPTSGPTNVPLADADAQDLDAVLEFLTGSVRPSGGPAPTGRQPTQNQNEPTITSIAIAPPSGFRILASLRVRGVTGRLLEQIDIGVATPGQITFRSGEIYRSAAQARVPTMIQQWLLNPLGTGTAAEAQVEPSK